MNATLTINAAPTIGTASPLPSGSLTAAYTTTLVGSAGTTPYTWSATGLPAGLSIAAGTGVISGTPTVSGAFTPAITLTDTAGATVTNNFTLTINPQPSITSVVLANKAGGTAGLIQQGDTITITFSTTMSVSSLCSTWSNNANNQFLSAANPNTVTVTSATCTFNLRSINLASNAARSSLGS